MSRNVLITAASRRVPLVQAFQRALTQSGEGGTVIVTDVNPLSPAVYVADRAFRVPLATEPGYIDDVLAIAVAEQVGLVVPTIDDELPLFGRAADRFAAVRRTTRRQPVGLASIASSRPALRAGGPSFSR